MIRRLLPHPGLSALLVVMWMVMVNDLTFGTLFLGLVVGVAVPIFTAPWWPGRPRVTPASISSPPRWRSPALLHCRRARGWRAPMPMPPPRRCSTLPKARPWC